MKFRFYRTKILDILSEEVRKNGQKIDSGFWCGKSKPEYRHILPIEGKNTRRNRIAVINKYLGIKIDDNFLPSKSKGRGETLHPYVHHLNSSQLLCYNTFSNLLTIDHQPKPELIELFHSLGIEISESAICDFEFSDGWMWEKGNETEGTSFDFHIQDGEKEFFFEIKFTEDGFGRAKLDDRHIKKINDIYIKRIAEVTKLDDITQEECAEYYQLFRNLIRGNSDLKTIIFITDENNQSTKNDIENFRLFLKDSPVNVQFLTWQQINNNWPKNVVKPFQFVCFDHPASF